MIRSNVHTHTRMSDGRDSAEQMVLAAIERGFTSLGFSDHGVTPHDAARLRDEMGYRAEIRRMKEKFSGQIEIAMGYEHDASMPGQDVSAYDYVIESVHFLETDEGFKPIDLSRDSLQEWTDRYFGGDHYKMSRHYFDLVCRSMDAKCDVVGHIGLVSKFNEGKCMFDTDDKRYVDPAMETVKLAVEKGLLVEVNTGAMSRGYRKSPYPDRRLLKYLNELGGRVIVTSDCHRAEWIDFAFDQAYELVKDCGFKSAWVWKNGKFVEEGI